MKKRSFIILWIVDLLIVPIGITLALIIFSTCQKNNTSSKPPLSFRRGAGGDASRTIGDNARHFDLYIPTLITNVRGWEQQYGYFGLWMPDSRRLYNINGTWQIGYNCPIGNDAPQAANGANDFVVDRSQDGIIDTTCYGCYDFPGLTQVNVFKIDSKGFPTQTTIFQKQEYDVEATDFINDYNNNLHRYYAFDTMAIQAKTFDRYYNYAPIPGGSLPDPGNYIICVQVDPDKLTADYNRTNNVTMLPITIKPGMTDGSIPELNTGLLTTKTTQKILNLIKR